MAARKVQLKDNSGNKAYPVTSSVCVGMSDGSGNLDEKISGIISNSGYVTCTAAAGTAAKTVTQAGFALSTNCRLIVKMANYNTATSPTLNVNNTGAKPLYYNGEVASADNTWEAGEVLDVYYDGTNYQASNIQGNANDEQYKSLMDFGGSVANLLTIKSYEALDSSSWEGGYLDANGVSHGSGYAITSDYISVTNKIVRLVTNSSDPWAIAVFYDKNYKVVDSVSHRDYDFYENNSTVYDFVITKHLLNPAIIYAKFVIHKEKGTAYLSNYNGVPDSIQGTDLITVLNGFNDFKIQVTNLLSIDDFKMVETTDWTEGYVDTGGISHGSGYAITSDYIEVTGRKIRLITNTSDPWALAVFYDADHNVVSGVSGHDYDFWEGTNVVYEFEITQHLSNPSIVYAKLVMNKEKGTAYLTDSGLIEELPSGEAKSTKKYASIRHLGYLPNSTVYDADICYIPMYGQSYATANDGNYKLTDVFDGNCYMHDDADPIGAGDTTLRPLNTTTNKEYVVSDFADVFSKILKRYFTKQDILVQSYGQGSRSVLELQKNNGYENPDYHTFEDILMPGVANAVQACENAEKTVICPFFLYLQGESDVVTNRTTGATTTSQCNGDKDKFKTELVKLKNQVQELIMSETGQSTKPLMIMYNPGNQNFQAAKSGVSQAVIELVNENEDIFSIGPYYQMTSMGAHPSPDGRRWLAEKFAEIAISIQMRAEYPYLTVKSAEVSGNKLYLYCQVPAKPLVIDTWTVAEKSDYGFTLYANENAEIILPIESVEVYSDYIVITAGVDLESQTGLFVTYANSRTGGNGNIRDSYDGHSVYTYESNENGTGSIVYKPLDKEGHEIIGKKYPLNNWLPSFGISVKNYIEDITNN